MFRFLYLQIWVTPLRPCYIFYICRVYPDGDHQNKQSGPCRNKPGYDLRLLAGIFWVGPLQCCEGLEFDSKPRKRTTMPLNSWWCRSSFQCAANILSVGCLYWWCNRCHLSLSNIRCQGFMNYTCVFQQIWMFSNLKPLVIMLNKKWSIKQ